MRLSRQTPRRRNRMFLRCKREYGAPECCRPPAGCRIPEGIAGIDPGKGDWRFDSLFDQGNVAVLTGRDDISVAGQG